jgi:hypothetical protein
VTSFTDIVALDNACYVNQLGRCAFISRAKITRTRLTAVFRSQTLRPAAYAAVFIWRAANHGWPRALAAVPTSSRSSRVCFSADALVLLACIASQQTNID